MDAPTDQITRETVFSDINYAESAETGIYSKLSEDGFASGTQVSVTFLAGLSGDDFNIHSNLPEYSQFYDNTLLPGNTTVSGLWNSCYKSIYSCNSVIQGLENASFLDLSGKSRLLAEAKFLRAFSHFYLTTLYGDVPIVTTTSVDVTKSLPRDRQEDVFLQIERDLIEARDILPESFDAYGGERIRATKYSASALLARLYLYKKDWPRAEAESTRIIDNKGQFSLLQNLNDVFLKNSKEAIWQLVPRLLDTREANVFIIRTTPNNASLSKELFDSFDTNDLRRSSWIGIYSSASDQFYFPNKYKTIGSSVLTEYSMVLRLSEQFLIRAEARLNQNKLLGNEGAASDINRIRNRAGLVDTPATTREDLFLEIVNQRRFELFSEWGHRWLDLKRLDLATIVLKPIKPYWTESSVIYPIPQYDIVNNSNLIQNYGYPN